MVNGAFKDHLTQHRQNIVDAWCDCVISTYPAEGSAFMLRTKDRFTNPVGYTITENLGALYDLLCEGYDRAAAEPLLDVNIR